MFSTKYDNVKKEWTGHNVPPIFNPKISLAHVLLKSCAANNSRIAQISDNNGIKLTFDEIRLKTIRVAQNLQMRRYKPKQVFSLMAKNSHHVAPIVFGSISIGCAVNTLDPSFGKTELIHMLSTIKPTLMFCDIDNYDLVRECLTELENDAKIYTFGGSKGEVEPVENLLSETNIEDEFVPVNVDSENDVAIIACSSGTSGLSKGVCLSHAMILSSISQGILANATDVLLSFSSLYWLSGILFLLLGTMAGATRIITTDAFSPELHLRFIRQYKVSIALNAPHHLTLILKSAEIANADFSSLKLQATGGSKVPMHVKNELNSYLPNGHVYVGYGMSEVCGLISFDDPSAKHKDSVGRLVIGTHMKIVDDDGNRCGVNVDGEICLKMNYKCLGYYENKKSTDELFDDEGFIKSGDLGHFDEDGYLYIVDRKKDVLKYCNMQISPSDIEAYLIESPHIKSACVFGVPDNFAGELPAAAIVKNEGSNITEKEIHELVTEHYSDICKLRGGVYFVDTLPTTPSGKVLRRLVKESAIELYNLHKE